MQTTEESDESPLSKEVTSTVARLLAKENITVTRSGGYQTAWFDPRTRVLGLPLLKTESKKTIDLMVGHEVGHSLYTPRDLIDRWKAEKIGPFSMCNILEDIRIEKKIQNEYPGLIRPFREGYRELWEADFFGVKSGELNDLSFMDRLNLKAKMPWLDIEFSSSEEYYRKKAMAIQTVADLFRVARELAKAQPPQPNETSEDGSAQKDQSGSPAEEDPNSESEQSQDSTGEDSESDDLTDEDSETPDSNGEDSESESGETLQEDVNEEDQNNVSPDDAGEGEDDGNNEEIDSEKSNPTDLEDESEDQDDYEESDSLSAEDLESVTDRNFEESLQNDLADQQRDFNFLVPPREVINKCVHSYKDVMKARLDENSNFYQMKQKYGAETAEHYKAFQKNSKKFVASLRREFEQKKAAFQYSRATESPRGVIDVNRLHKYRYEENIFSAVTNLADAKSHGMVFLVDFSGSMRETIGKILRHTLNLVEFCRSVGIPFEVYTFTEFTRLPTDNPIEVDGMMMLQGTRINQILSSSMTRQEYQTAACDLFLISHLNGIDSYITTLEVFGTTPLLESLVILNHLVKDFQKRNPHQVTNLMVLTDGEGRTIYVRKNIGDTLDYRGQTGYGRICGGKYRKIDFSDYFGTYEALVENLKETCNCNMIGFFVVSNDRYAKRQVQSITRMIQQKKVRKLEKMDQMTYYKILNLADEKARKIMREFRKEGVVTFDDFVGYDNYILYRSTRRSSFGPSSFAKTNISSDATNAQLTKEFKNFSVAKKSEKVFVNEFVKTISTNL